MMPAKQQSPLVSLRYLLEGMVQSCADVFVSNISVDARSIESDGVFIAVAGSKSHGLMYAEQAIHAGAIAIIYDSASGGEFLAEKVSKQHDVCLVELPNIGESISEIAARFYRHPARQLSVVGVTGTNGKTSVSHFIAQALSAEQSSCGVIGTLGWGVMDELKETINTTPDAASVQQQLAELLGDGVSTVAMEVSSHGLDQDRVKAVDFKGAVFTNLSHDHLDYHQTLDAYGEAKLELFKAPSLEFAVLNNDDEFSEKIIKTLSSSVRVLTFSRVEKRDGIKDGLFISNEELVSTGLSFDLSFNGQSAHINSGLFGDFNIDNIVATVAVLIALGDAFEVAVRKIAVIKGVQGRMQVVLDNESAVSVIVDYAHTPDALKLALLSLRKHCDGTLSVVFGCGGDRDKAKRPLMGAIAAELADSVIITNDNPRLESAEDIACQIESGIQNSTNVQVNLDREQAIRQAVDMAAAGDIILVAGKGHEDYQQIGDVKTAFSDIDSVKKALKDQLTGENGCKP